jgi:hypothetical protein
MKRKGSGAIGGLKKGEKGRRGRMKRRVEELLVARDAAFRKEKVQKKKYS